MHVADLHSHGVGRTARLAAVVATLGLVATAFATTGGASTGARRVQQGKGGDITFGLEAETTNYCLSSAQLAISGIQVVAALYDTLTLPNSKGVAVPYLAKSVEPNADFTEWTIGLREGITFHNGEALNADVVKLNLDNYRGAPGAEQGGLLFSIILKFIADVQVVDPLTVKVVLNTPVPSFPQWLYANGRVGIMAPEQIASGDSCATNMIGTGPFKLREFNQNESTIVEAYEDYWQKGFPKAKSITFVPVVDGSSRVTQLQGGQLDMIHTSSGLLIDTLNQQSGELNILEQKPGVREIRYYILLAKEGKVFADPKARQAFGLALDRKKINELRNGGLFDDANSIMDKGAPGYLKNAGFPKFNLKKAKALVEEVKAASGSFDITLGTTTDAENSAEAQTMQEQLEAAGINAELAQFDQATLIAQALSGGIDVLLWRNLHGGYTDFNDFDTYPWFASASAGYPTNFSGYEDPASQAALDAGRGASDPAAISQAYEDLNKAIAENVFVLPVWFVNWAIGSQSNVKVTFPKIPDGGGKILFVYGRVPVHGLSKS